MTRLAMLRPALQRVSIDGAADAYDALARDYLHYADGGEPLADFSSRYAFADREVWARIDRALVDFHAAGNSAIRILDIGCGPGTWLIRACRRAIMLGFRRVEASGFDVSGELIALARAAAAEAAMPGIELCFNVADLQTSLALQADHSVDLTLCLYGVLNHLPASAHQAAARDMARATAGQLIATVRTVGSTPSIYVTGIEEARGYHRDPTRDRLEIDLKDGRHIEFDFHLFTAAEFRGLFEPRLRIDELIGLDLFHTRFSRDPDWHAESGPDDAFESRLIGLERLCGTDPGMINHAAHILLCASRTTPDGAGAEAEA